jgi:hypothetical protein
MDYHVTHPRLSWKKVGDSSRVDSILKVWSQTTHARQSSTIVYNLEPIQQHLQTSYQESTTGMADIKDWRSLSDSTPEWEAVRTPPQW